MATVGLTQRLRRGLGLTSQLPGLGLTSQLPGRTSQPPGLGLGLGLTSQLPGLTSQPPGLGLGLPGLTPQPPGLVWLPQSGWAGTGPGARGTGGSRKLWGHGCVLSEGPGPTPKNATPPLRGEN